ncbi:hypothetical protein HK100_000266 [Physocladia obscura]|uniref:Uncharacterized protein n=1 Tax=Physocladia obscura TaxID=109957 RepID=A0AAD5XKE7_9FUNG|nr:hypothetical protein HK100_000266 [Physocladia obscura]
MLNTNGLYFTDESTGNTVFLRGVNLSGSAKLPFTPSIPSHKLEGFLESTRNVSFVGRPFPIHEADEHFARLRTWGFNLLRFCVTWEALEHEGPRIYDYEFIDYIVAILVKAREYNFKIFVDPHQDVWSRFTGGSGAPAWTIDVVGLDIRHFKATGAAVIHNTSNKSEYTKMVWVSNYDKLACATMFTVFYGGATFAPKLKSPDDASESIQDYLQDHFCDAFVELAKRIGQNDIKLVDDVVLGYDTLNEPDCGWIGAKDLNSFCGTRANRIGHSPTPFQAMKLGSGQSCFIEKYEMSILGPRKTGTVHIDPNGESAWLPLPNNVQRPCLWSDHGVWDVTTSKLLKPDYFTKHPITGKPVSFVKQFWSPFVEKFTAKIRAVHERAIIFVEPCGHASPLELEAPIMPESLDFDDRVVNSPHWYDGLTLINKWFNPYFSVDYVGWERKKYLFAMFAVKIGINGIRQSFFEQICTLRDDAVQPQTQSNHPTVIGEIGIPIDLENGQAYKNGDFSMQERALDTNMRALESSFVSFTLWNYTSTNSHEFGDEWNGEDLSIWSRSDQKIPYSFASRDINDGARALKAFCRPYPVSFPGVPKKLTFDMESKEFVFSFLCSRKGTVDLYVPSVHYGSSDEKIDVKVNNGAVKVKVKSQKRILWVVEDEGVICTIQIKVKK